MAVPVSIMSSEEASMGRKAGAEHDHTMYRWSRPPWGGRLELGWRMGLELVMDMAMPPCIEPLVLILL